MGKVAVTFRVSQEAKDAIYDFAEKAEIPPANLIQDFAEQIAEGNAEYDNGCLSFRISGANTSVSHLNDGGNGFIPEATKNENKGNLEGIPQDADRRQDFSELYEIAKRLRVTPESFLNKLLAPYRR